MAEAEYDGDEGYDYEEENRRQAEDKKRNEAEAANGGQALGTVQGAYGNYTNYGAITDKEAGDPLYNQRQAEFEGQTDWNAVREYLKRESASRGIQFDESDLQGIQRNAGYDAAHQGAGGGYASAFQRSLENAIQNYDQRASNTPGGQQMVQGSGGSGSGSRGGFSGQGGFGGGGSSLTNQWLDYIKQRDAAVGAQREEQNARAASLWNTLQGRAGQALDVTGNPAVRQASDAYRANEDRAARNYLGDIAEQSGPLSNLRSEQRMASERVGQRTGTHESELVIREMEAVRNEIAQALQMQLGMISGEQARAMQEQIALLDAAIREQGVGLVERGQDLDWQRALLQNTQFQSELGLRAEDLASTWDYRRMYPGLL